MSDLASWQKWFWALNVGVQIGLCYLIVRRGTYKYMSLLFFYLISDLGRSAVILASYQHWGFSSWASYIVAWSTQAVVVAARGMAVAEICKNSLHQYAGIWALGWRILAIVGAVVVLYAALAPLTVSKKTLWVAVVSMVLAADRGLELALVAVLLSLLIFARYYRVPLGRPHKALAVGFGLFSSVAVLNDSVLSVFLRRYISVWNGIETSSYFVVLVAWLRAFYKLVPVRPLAPALIPQAMYDEHIPQMNERLRELNDRLRRIFKS
jgi:hypothetical protein